MATSKVVTHDEWLSVRKGHLTKEKEFTRLRDQLSKERRDLPWELVEKEYVFEGENGRQTLAEIFDGRSQLVVYHAMFNPETAGQRTPWTTDAACFVCSFWMDNFNGVTLHLNHRDITMDYDVSFTPEELNAGEVEYNYRRTGWSGSEAPGISVFLNESGQIYHTYSTYERGLDMLNVAYHYMDLVPKGRDEDKDGAGSWVHRRDEYQD